MINKKIMNQIVKIFSQKQNDKLKLNSGQIREAVSIIFEALYSLDLSVLSAGKDVSMKKAATKKVATKKATPKKK